MSPTISRDVWHPVWPGTSNGQFNQLEPYCLWQRVQPQIGVLVVPESVEVCLLRIDATCLPCAVPGAVYADRFEVAEGLRAVVRRAVEGDTIALIIGEDPELVVEVAVENTCRHRHPEVDQSIGHHPGQTGEGVGLESEFQVRDDGQ